MQSHASGGPHPVRWHGNIYERYRQYGLDGAASNLRRNFCDRYSVGLWAQVSRAGELQGQSTRTKSIEKEKEFETRDSLLSLMSEFFGSPRDVCFAGTNEIEVRSSRWRDLFMKPDCGSLVYWIVRIEILP